MDSAHHATSAETTSWLNALPMKRMGSGALIRNEHGAVLLVETTYTSFLEVPGAPVEADESPRQACTREIQEELGLRIDVGRLLCLEWQGPEDDRSESLMFIYDGGVVTGPFNPILKTDELQAFRFVSPSDLMPSPSSVWRAVYEPRFEALACGALVELRTASPPLIHARPEGASRDEDMHGEAHPQEALSSRSDT